MILLFSLFYRPRYHQNAAVARPGDLGDRSAKTLTSCTRSEAWLAIPASCMLTRNPSRLAVPLIVERYSCRRTYSCRNHHRHQILPLAFKISLRLSGFFCLHFCNSTTMLRSHESGGALTKTSVSDRVTCDTGGFEKLRLGWEACRSVEIGWKALLSPKMQTR